MDVAQFVIGINTIVYSYIELYFYRKVNFVFVFLYIFYLKLFFGKIYIFIETQIQSLNMLYNSIHFEDHRLLLMKNRLAHELLQILT